MVAVNNYSTFEETFRNARVLITGNTGFKGTWLTMWLHKLGAQVAGFSNDFITNPSMYKILELNRKVYQVHGDICNGDLIQEILHDFKPDFIFHLAAQSIVSEGYKDPLQTFKTNSLGTATLLDAMLRVNFSGAAVIVTSDKCYENDERSIGYKENDRLGGRDPYSASKASAEIFLSSYLRSFFIDSTNAKIGVARAGNVIGGGDWNSNRIVVDCVKSWMQGEKVVIRNPNSTRPWQHVLEPISGYLKLAQLLTTDLSLNGEAFNFGPIDSSVHTVFEVVKKFGLKWGLENVNDFIDLDARNKMHEASLLKLNCEKAANLLKWHPKLDIDECLNLVAMWYLEYKKEPNNLLDLTVDQITFYETKGM